MHKTRMALGCALAALLFTACSGNSSSLPSAQPPGTQSIMMVRAPVASPFALRDARGRIVPHAHVMLTREAAWRLMQPDRGGHKTNNLTYHNGPIQSTPAIYVVFWGFGKYGDPSGEQAYMTNFLNKVGGSKWLNIDHQYFQSGGIFISNPTGQLKGTIVDGTNPVPSSPSDSQVAAEADYLASQFGGANPNASYVVATPTGHNINGFGSSFCAYHSYNGTVSYTNMPYITDAGPNCGSNFINSGSAGTDDGISVVGGHELAETQTDPQPSSGWVDSRGSEIGDKCAWSPSSADVSFGGSSLGTNEFPVQPLWSNAVSGCALSF